MPKVIDVEKWGKALGDSTSEGSANLVTNYTARTGKAAALSSEDALTNFKTRVVSEKALKKRSRKMKALTDEILNKGMLATGSTNYTTNLGAALEKAKAGYKPYAEAINAELTKLPKKTADGKANLLNRAGAIINAEMAKKAELG